jgi:nickel superoxide dismutase
MKFLNRILRPSTVAHAHCDGPCGVYDPASARIAVEAALSMTKKLIALEGDDLATQNTRARFIAIKEQQAQIAKDEILIIWTDYFKPMHLEGREALHTRFWEGAKLCSQVKTEVNEDAAEKLMGMMEELHNVFWESKGRTDVPFYRAG